MICRSAFTAEEIKAFSPAEKIGLLASIDPTGAPHITLITSMRAAAPSQLTLGEFCKGRSKSNIQKNPRAGFLIMTLDRRMWRGRARWTHLRSEGPEYEQYNNLPMFRYNTYFGINTVHYLDLVETTGAEALPMTAIALGALWTRLARGAAAAPRPVAALSPFARKLFNRLDALKFLAWVGPGGFPQIVPVIQCQAADSGRLAFSPCVFAAELQSIPDGAQAAVFGLTMAMEDVLVRGRYRKARRFRGIRLGSLDIEWVYNSMPPCHGQIYPPVPLRPVEEFD